MTQAFVLKPSYNNRSAVLSMNVYTLDKSDFHKFYEETVPFGSGMSLNDFQTYPYVEQQLLLSEKKVIKDDMTMSSDRISDVWIDLWSCNCMCLSEGQAYQTLCTLFDENKYDKSV